MKVEVVISTPQVGASEGKKAVTLVGDSETNRVRVMTQGWSREVSVEALEEGVRHLKDILRG